MSRRISSLFIAQGVIPENDREVYIYSFEILLSTVVNFIAVILVAIVSGTVPETSLYLLGFIPLRQITGGYHAKNHLRCFFILMLSYAAFLLFLFYLPPESVVWAIVLGILLSVVLVLALAPSEDKNKPFSNEEVIYFKKRSRFSIVAYAVAISLLAAIIADHRFAFSLTLGVFTVGASLLANFIKYESSKNKKYRRVQKGVN
jgi:accessory gene regulator B